MSGLDEWMKVETVKYDSNSLFRITHKTITIYSIKTKTKRQMRKTKSVRGDLIEYASSSRYLTALN